MVNTPQKITHGSLTETHMCMHTQVILHGPLDLTVKCTVCKLVVKLFIVWNWSWWDYIWYRNCQMLHTEHNIFLISPFKNTPLPTRPSFPVFFNLYFLFFNPFVCPLEKQSQVTYSFSHPTFLFRDGDKKTIFLFIFFTSHPNREDSSNRWWTNGTITLPSIYTKQRSCQSCPKRHSGHQGSFPTWHKLYYKEWKILESKKSKQSFKSYSPIESPYASK